MNNCEYEFHGFEGLNDGWQWIDRGRTGEKESEKEQEMEREK